MDTLLDLALTLFVIAQAFGILLGIVMAVIAVAYVVLHTATEALRHR